MSTCSSSPATRATDDHASHVHVLKWIFRRNGETVSCELRLTRDDSCYELRTEPPQHHAGDTPEYFDDALAAFKQHAALERLLLREGWSLESFDSERVKND